MQHTSGDRDVFSALAAALRCVPHDLVAIDGRPGVGKTTLARHLSQHLGTQFVETDRFLRPDPTRPANRYGDLRRAIEAQRRKSQPLIVEGIAILDTLDWLDVRPGLVILVRDTAGPSVDFLPDYFREYEERFRPATTADIIVEVSSADGSGDVPGTTKVLRIPGLRPAAGLREPEGALGPPALGLQPTEEATESASLEPAPEALLVPPARSPLDSVPRYGA